MAVPQAERKGEKAPPKGEMKRLQFDFPLAAVCVLQELAEETGEPTLAGVVRDALKVYTWIVEEQKQGRRLVLEDKKGQSKREIVLLLKYQNAAWHVRTIREQEVGVVESCGRRSKVPGIWSSYWLAIFLLLWGCIRRVWNCRR